VAINLAPAARQIAAARRRLAETMKTGQHVAIEAHKEGKAESVIARELGVNRLTVRRWLGK
jgi:DNA invertase Pin-like site-specific DNA recombinase